MQANSTDERVPDDRQDDHYIERSWKSRVWQQKKGRLPQGIEVSDWFPKRLVEQNLLRVALEHPLLATIWTFHEIRRVKRKDAGWCALEC